MTANRAKWGNDRERHRVGLACRVVAVAGTADDPPSIITISPAKSAKGTKSEITMRLQVAGTVTALFWIPSINAFVVEIWKIVACSCQCALRRSSQSDSPCRLIRKPAGELRPDRLRDVDRDFSHRWTLPENQRDGHLAHPDSSSASTFMRRSDVNSSGLGAANRDSRCHRGSGNHATSHTTGVILPVPTGNSGVCWNGSIHQPLRAFHKTPNSPSAVNATRNPHAIGQAR